MATRIRATMRLSVAVMLSVAALAAGGCTSDFKPPIVPTLPSDPPTPSPTFTLSGVVTEMSESGAQPVAGAVVQEIRSFISTLTDFEGRYRISGLRAGSTSVRTTKPGFTTITSSIEIDADAQLDLSLVPVVPYVISGLVFELTPSGKVPVEDVQIYCDSCGSPVGHTFTTTDAQGRYHFDWSIAGTHVLLVSKAGYRLVYPDDDDGPEVDYEFIQVRVSGDTNVDIEVLRR